MPPALASLSQREFFSSRTSVDMLVLRSYMPEHGVSFSAVLEQDYVAFNAGAVVTVSVAARKARLIVKR